MNCLYYTKDMSEFHKVILQPTFEGAYIFIYKTAESEFPEKDYLLDDLDDAKRFCEQELNLAKDGWEEDASIIKLMG